MACPEHTLVLRPMQVIRRGCSHRDWRRFLTSSEEDQCPTQSAHVPRGRGEGVLGPRRTTLHKLSAVACSGVRTAIMHALRLRSEEHTSELQSRVDLVCRLLLEK